MCSRSLPPGCQVTHLKEENMKLRKQVVEVGPAPTEETDGTHVPGTVHRYKLRRTRTALL